MSAAPVLSVVVPVYNEEQVLPLLRERLSSALDRTGVSWEVVLVNDGSRDRSWELMRAIAAGDPRWTLVNLSRNFGHQCAITAGLDHARGEAVVVMDADLQDPPEVLLEMLARWREGYDVVYGRRSRREGESAFKLATAAVFYRLIRRLTAVDIPADTGDFRLMSRRAVEALRRFEERNRFVRGLVAWIGFRQTEVRYDRAARAAGETKYPLRKMMRFAADAIVSFSFAPLRLATMLGFVVSLLSFGYGLWALFERLTGRGDFVQGWASLMIGLSFLGGVQLVCVGIVGEYLGRIYDEVKRRPLYLTQEVVPAGAATTAGAAAPVETPPARSP